MTRGPAKPMSAPGSAMMDVAEHGVGRGDAAGGRIGEHDDVGQLLLAERLHGDGRARQLHQRQHALLHARAARGGEHDERPLAIDGGHHAGDDRLAGRHAERAAHEVEILHGGDDRHVLDRRRHRPARRRSCRSWRGRRAAGRCSGARRGTSADRAAPRAAAIVSYSLPSKKCASRWRGGHAHVIAGAGNDELVQFEVAVEDHLAGLRTLDPQILGDTSRLLRRLRIFGRTTLLIQLIFPLPV